MILSQKAQRLVEKRSRVGAMFSAGERLKKDDKRPIDLMLGNPIQKPDSSFYSTFSSILAEMKRRRGNPHRYMDNAGYGETRKVMADFMTEKTGLAFQIEDIIMTLGCANGLDVCLASFLEPGLADEVVIFTPGFMEYNDYIALNGGVPVPVPLDDRFKINYNLLDQAISQRTCALILNFPSNPTGQILLEQELADLAAFLKEKNRKFAREILVLEDSPYDQIYFDRAPTTILRFYRHTIYLTSFSKTHGLAGERIGFMAVHPRIGAREERLFLHRILANTLRFRVVNAPGLMQRVIARIGCHGSVDVATLERRVRKLEAILGACGYGVVPAAGGFFVFAAIPEEIPDQESWMARAMSGPEPLLAVPGQLFGGDRYSRFVRFSVTVPDREIERAVRRIEKMHKR